MQSKRKFASLVLLLAVAACGTVPQQGLVPEAASPASLVGDGENYPGGNTYRLLAAAELPVVATSADSSGASAPPSNMVDGNLATSWQNGGYRNATAWAAVQLSAPASLASIAIKTGPSPAGTSYDIQVSGDGTSWTTALAGQTNTTWNLETKGLPANTSGKYVRVFWHNSATAPQAHFAIYELVVNGGSGSAPSPSPTPAATPTPTPTPVPSSVPTPAPSATPTGPSTNSADQSYRATSATASSTYAGLTPAMGIDGNTSTQWASGGYQDAQDTFTMDFGQTLTFDLLKAKTGALPANVSYQAEVSADGASWQPASAMLTNTTWNVEDKTIYGTGRYLRLHFHNSSSQPLARFSLYEAQVTARAGSDPSFPLYLTQAPSFQMQDYGVNFAQNSKNGQFLATWTHYGSVVARLLDVNGHPLSDLLNLTPSPYSVYQPHVVYSPSADQYLVAWWNQHASDGSVELAGQVLGADGKPVGGQRVLVPHLANTAAGVPMAYDATSQTYLLVYLDGRVVTGPRYYYGLSYQVLDAQFNAVGAPVPIGNAPTMDGQQVAASAHANGFVITWDDSAGGTYAQRVSGSGVLQGSPFKAATGGNAAVAFNWRDNQYLLATRRALPDGSVGLDTQRLDDATGNPVGSPISLQGQNQAGNNLSLTFDGRSDAFLLTYDIFGSQGSEPVHAQGFLQHLAADGTAQDSPTRLLDAPFWNDALASVFDYTSGRFLVGWADSRNGTISNGGNVPSEIFARWLR